MKNKQTDKKTVLFITLENDIKPRNNIENSFTDIISERINEILQNKSVNIL